VNRGVKQVLWSATSTWLSTWHCPHLLLAFCCVVEMLNCIADTVQLKIQAVFGHIIHYDRPDGSTKRARNMCLLNRDVKASRPMWPQGQIIWPRPHSFWPRPHGIWPRPHRNWPQLFTVHMTLIYIHNIAIDNHFCCVLVAYWKLCCERLNANILVFMLIHTELFCNVSGLGL